MSRSERTRRSLDRHLEEASWRHERTINRLRTVIWFSIGVALVGVSLVTGRPGGMAPWFLVFSVLCALFGLTFLRHRFNPLVPWVTGFLDVTVLLASLFFMCADTFGGDEVTRTIVISGSGMGLMLILACNALRLDWRISAWVGAYAIVGFLVVRSSMEAEFRAEWLIDALVLACETVVISLSVVRSRQIAEQLFGEMRNLQDERVKVMGRLVAGTAHELNTPLGTLGSSLHTLQRAVSVLEEQPHRTDRARVAIQQATGNARGAMQRIEEVLGGLSAFARPDAATIEDLDVDVGLKSSARLVQSQSAGHLQVELALSPLPQVRGNAAQLNMVFLNLIKNAAEAMDGRGLVQVSAEPVGSDVSIEIRDHGPGIPPQLIERLFEPAFQRGQRVKMGLGLAVSRSILQEHGGELELESGPSGTTARVLLPAVTRVHQAAAIGRGSVGAMELPAPESA